MAVGDLIAARGTDADLGTGIGYDAQRALDGVGRGVMVDDGGRPSFERLERAEHRRPPDHLQIKGAVEPPPYKLEDLLKVVGYPRRRRHPTGKCGVEVMVATHEPWGNSSLGQLTCAKSHRGLTRLAGSRLH